MTQRLLIFLLQNAAFIQGRRLTNKYGMPIVLEIIIS